MTEPVVPPAGPAEPVANAVNAAISADAAALPVETAGPREYKDDDMVYVDPDTNSVVGLVEWSRNGNPKSMPVKRQLSEADAEKEVSRRGRWRKFYPFGTYRSMKNVFKVAGKQKRKDPNRTLEEILPKALEQAFWND